MHCVRKGIGPRTHVSHTYVRGGMHPGIRGRAFHCRLHGWGLGSVGGGKSAAGREYKSDQNDACYQSHSDSSPGVRLTYAHSAPMLHACGDRTTGHPHTIRVMPSPSLFLFDIDGTLLSGAVAVHRDAFRYATEKVYGIALALNGIVTAGRTDSWILVEALRRHGVGDARIEEGMPHAFSVMETYVQENLGDLRHTVLPGVPEILEALQESGHTLGLLTGNLQGIAAAKMHHAGLGGCFVAGGYGAESQVRALLVPAALQSVGLVTGRMFGIPETVLIGDTPLDIEAARASGTRVVAVATGRFSMDALRRVDPDLLLSSLADPGTLQALLTM